jgi:hypothetical protein
MRIDVLIQSTDSIDLHKTGKHLCSLHFSLSKERRVAAKKNRTKYRYPVIDFQKQL